MQFLKGILVTFVEKCFTTYHLKKEESRNIVIEDSLIEGVIDFRSREKMCIKIRMNVEEEWHSIFIAHTMEDFYHFAGALAENLTRCLTNNNSFLLIFDE